MMYCRSCCRIIVSLCAFAILGCADIYFVELRVRDSVTKEPLKSGAFWYEYDIWVPALLPPVYLNEQGGGRGVDDGIADIQVCSNTSIRIELWDAVGYPRTVVKLVSPQKLNGFKPTPWKNGQVADPAATAQPARILEFQLAPRQQSASSRPSRKGCDDPREETNMPAR
jgi:hypothetical protein